MKALTICQPYAELILRGDKGHPDGLLMVENRPWRTAHRGLVLIHAGSSKHWLSTYEGELPEHLDYGAIVGKAELIEIVRYVPGKTRVSAPYEWLADCPHASGAECWILKEPQRFEKPIPCGGKQGLWEVAKEIERAVERAIKKLAKK